MRNFIKETGMDTLTAITTRRSVRNFTGESLTQEQIDTILNAGFCAPSGMNRRPWEFVVVRNKDTFAKIAERCSNMSMLTRGADTAIVLCGNTNAVEDTTFHITDCSAAAENMLLTAHALGLAGVWCHAVNPERQPVFTELLELPDNVRSVMLLALGHPAETPEIPERFAEEHVHAEKFGAK